MSKFTANKGLTFDDVLIVPKYSEIKSRSDVITTRGTIGMPLIPANMDTITGVAMWHHIAKQGGFGILHRYMPIEELKVCLASIDLRANKEGFDPSGEYFVSVGILDNDKARIDELIEQNSNDCHFCVVNYCIDVAHGDCRAVLDTIEYIRNGDCSLPIIIAGNVATKDAARRLFKAGADIAKVGIGPGSVCSTRIKTGVGVPQLTAIMECAQEGKIIADGGFKHVGDCVKALAVSKNVIGCMSGSLFAGTDLTPIWEGVGIHCEYRGMASKEAQIAFKGKFANTEGISSTLYGKPKGSTQDVINEFLEGLRSAMSYVGCTEMLDFADCCQFMEVSSHTSMENIPHFGVHKK